MNKQEAVTLSKDTFSGGFDETQFTKFITNLFKGYEPLAANVSGGQLKEAFKPFVSHYKRIGKYTDAEGNVIDTIIVHLKKGSSLERARTAQRNFVAEYLKARDKEAALVAFLSPDSSDWRLSLVKFETTFQHDEEKGKLKMVNETTPAKRWSFLIGENEGKHTVTSRFLDSLKSDVSPNLAELEAAFDVETVSEEFYEKYKELFLRMKDALDELVKKDLDVRADFEAKEISTVDFAKKTMGQLAFLYFLQKKGWFGVTPKAAWGTGRKDFLRNLFNKRGELQVSHNLGINFFDDIMEPLFYDALASDRRDSDDFYNRLNCRMPFLNGGLFEPIQGYAWSTTHIRLPDELFSNQNKTKEGDVGDGILDVFDRYNFTVNESEPLEKEVAVDPEMLGKVFENLLEIKDRKSKGAYYTPREIVHYMCQQCLINHLEAELREQSSIIREDIEFLIQNGSRIIENDQTVIEKGKETGAYTFMLPESIRTQAKHMDELLASIKVCDPAVGSGAFPLGMLNEIIRARATLAVHQHQKIDYFELKKYTIINSLYGVDLDGGAVEIAKLRLWLALVVEEDEPHPLPNLECKIMQGNSLISQYEGITLFDETILEDIKSIETEKAEVTQEITSLQSHYFEVHGIELDQAEKQEQLKKIEKTVKGLKKRLQALSDPSSLATTEMSLFSPPQERKLAHEKSLKLQRLIKEYIETSHNKKTLKEEIDNLKWELIEATLREQGKAAKLDEVKALRERHEKPFFIWKLEFSDVFREKDGFDIVIGNPPYIGQKGHKEIFQEILPTSLGERFHQRRMDLFYFFFHLALDILKDGGHCAYITTNYFITATYADKLRLDLKDRAAILNLIDFDELKIFESAAGQHNAITVLEKNHRGNCEAKLTVTRRKGKADDHILNAILRGKDTETSYSTVSNEQLFEGPSNCIRLRANQENGDQSLQLIISKLRVGGVPLASVADIVQGILTGANQATNKKIKQWGLTASAGEGVLVLSENEVEQLKLNKHESNFIRKWYKNSDIGKWVTSRETSKRLIYIRADTHVVDEQIPNLLKHFSRFKSLLINRNVRTGTITEKQYEDFVQGKEDIPYVMIKSTFADGRFFCVSYAREESVFQGKKIVCPQFSSTNTFAFDEREWFAASDVYFIKQKKSSDIQLEYLIGLLNSKLIYFWLYHCGQRKGKLLQLFKGPLSEIPVAQPTPSLATQMSSLANQILSIKKLDPSANVSALEGEIDDLVFDLYKLTDEERQFVRGAVNKS